MGAWSDVYAGQPTNTAVASIALIKDRIDNVVDGLDGTDSLGAVDINGGTIDGAVLGAATKVTITEGDMNGGTIDGTPIGATTPSTLVATTITGTGDLAIDTDTLKVDAANDRVGVNQSAPETSLQVDNIGIEGNIISSRNTDGDIEITPNGDGVVKVTILTATAQPAARAYIDSQAGSTRDSWTILPLNEESFDQGDLYDKVGAPTRITITEPGLYHLSATIAFVREVDDAGAVNEISIRIKQDGTTVIKEEGYEEGNSSSLRGKRSMSASRYYQHTTGTAYFEVWYFVASTVGDAPTLEGGAEFNSFEVVKIS